MQIGTSVIPVPTFIRLVADIVIGRPVSAKVGRSSLP